VKIELINGESSIETVAIANSGFIGIEPEVLIPIELSRQLRLQDISEPEIHTKITGDGREVDFLKYRNVANVYIIAGDRIEGPVTCSILISPRARHVLLNDKLLGKLKVVLLDFGEGTWCFRDELGKIERKSL